MGITLNPFTGQLDFTGAGSSGPAIRQEYTFTAAVSWVAGIGKYTYTVLATAHGAGLNPSCQVFELISGSYELVHPTIVVNTSGDVTIEIASVPDLRFDGKIIIL